MQTQHPEKLKSGYFQNFSLYVVVALVLRMWRVIFLITLVVAGLVFALAMRSGTYESEGSLVFWGSIPANTTPRSWVGLPDYKITQPPRLQGITLHDDKIIHMPQLPGISLPDYKAYSEVFLNKDRFEIYVQKQKMESAPVVKELRRKFASRNGIAVNIRPIFPYSRAEAKDIPANLRENNNRITGIKLNYTHVSPEIAQQAVKLLGLYVMDSITYSSILEMLERKKDQLQADLAELDGKASSVNLERLRLERKAKELKNLANRTEKFQAASNQAFIVTDDTVRFLSPATQFMAAETETIELNERILADVEKRKKTQLLIEYYDSIYQVATQSQLGISILRELEPVRSALFKDKLNDNVAAIANSQISDQNLKIFQAYGERSNFINEPTLPLYSSFNPVKMALIGLLGGFLLALGIVLGFDWYRCTSQNHRSISN